MQVRVSDFKSGGVPCGCGRSPSGYCDGSHALTESQWQAKLEELIREEQELKDELDDE